MPTCNRARRRRRAREGPGRDERCQRAGTTLGRNTTQLPIARRCFGALSGLDGGANRSHHRPAVVAASIKRLAGESHHRPAVAGLPRSTSRRGNGEKARGVSEFLQVSRGKCSTEEALPSTALGKNGADATQRPAPPRRLFPRLLSGRTGPTPRSVPPHRGGSSLDCSREERVGHGALQQQATRRTSPSPCAWTRSTAAPTRPRAR